MSRQNWRGLSHVQANQPSSQSTIKPINHQANQPSSQSTETNVKGRSSHIPKPLIVVILLGSLISALAGSSQAQSSALTTYTSVGKGTNPDGTRFNFATSAGVRYTETPDFSGTPGTSGNFLVIPNTTAPGFSGKYSSYQSVQIDTTGTSPSANGFSGTSKWGDVKALNGQPSADILIGGFTMDPIIPGFNKSFYGNFPKFSSYYHTIGPSIYVAMSQTGNFGNVASAGSTSVW